MKLQRLLFIEKNVMVVSRLEHRSEHGLNADDSCIVNQPFDAK